MTEWLSESVTRSPIELFWTDKNRTMCVFLKRRCICFLYRIMYMLFIGRCICRTQWWGRRHELPVSDKKFPHQCKINVRFFILSKLLLINQMLPRPERKYARGGQLSRKWWEKWEKGICCKIQFGAKLVRPIFGPPKRILWNTTTQFCLKATAH